MLKYALNIFFVFSFIFPTNKIIGQSKVINNPEEGVWQDRNSNPINFELVQVFGSEFEGGNNVFLSRVQAVWGVDTDKEGCVYVLDIDIPLLAKFSPTGKLLWKIDRKGRGPGDLENAYSLAVADSIYISNIRGTRIDVFDKQGNFERSVSLNQLGENTSYYIVGTIKDKYLALKSEIMGSIGIEVHVLDIHNGLSLVSEFKVTEESGIDVPIQERMLSQASIIDNAIVITKNLSYGLQYYTLDGKLIKEFNREFSSFMRPGIYNPGNKRGYMVALGGVFSQYKISGGYLINTVVWPVNIEDIDEVAKKISEGNYPSFQQENSVDLYSPSGKLLYSIKGEGSIPAIGKLMHSDKKGFLYTVAKDPFPQVRKYRVVIEEKGIAD